MWRPLAPPRAAPLGHDRVAGGAPSYYGNGNGAGPGYGAPAGGALAMEHQPEELQDMERQLQAMEEDMATATGLRTTIVPALCMASSGSSEQKTKRNTCNPLVQEPPKVSTPATPPTTPAAPTTVPTPAPGQCYCTPAAPSSGPSDQPENGGFHSECPLIQSFRNITYSANLTIDEQVDWELFIEDCENEYLANSTLSDEEKVVAISIFFKDFCKKHKNIHKKISHKKIAEWGKCEDFLYIHISIRVEITESVCTLDASGSCQVLEALENATESMSQTDQDLVYSLIVDIKACLEDFSFSYQQKLAQIHLKCKNFFGKNPHLEEPIKKCHIKGYGSFEVLLSVCETFYSVVNIQDVLEGSDESDCVLIEAFSNATKDANVPLTYKTQLQEMNGKFKAFFKVNIDLSIRLKYVSQVCYNSSGLMPWLVEIYEELECGEWGDVFRMLFCSHLCSNNGPCNPGAGPGPNQVSSSVAPSTSVAPPSTSVAPASTTPKPADCTKVGSLIAVDSSNKTVLTTVLTNNYDSWNASMKVGFNNCFNNIRLAIWTMPTSPMSTPNSRSVSPLSGPTTTTVSANKMWSSTSKLASGWAPFANSSHALTKS
uniref:Uncharacterized protein n=1 Tax=Ditylenchus dipsaci TaxID=166011 RepID=A0A915EBC5_9BILA